MEKLWIELNKTVVGVVELACDPLPVGLASPPNGAQWLISFLVQLNPKMSTLILSKATGKVGARGTIMGIKMNSDWLIHADGEASPCR